MSLALLHPLCRLRLPPPRCSPRPPPVQACTCTCRCYRASSGPSLRTGDDTVSRSLLSQSKCHSGGWPFRWPRVEQAASMQAVTPVVPTTNWQTFFPATPPFLSLTIHVKTRMNQISWAQNRLCKIWLTSGWNGPQLQTQGESHQLEGTRIYLKAFSQMTARV